MNLASYACEKNTLFPESNKPKSYSALFLKQKERIILIIPIETLTSIDVRYLKEANVIRINIQEKIVRVLSSLLGASQTARLKRVNNSSRFQDKKNF